MSDYSHIKQGCCDGHEYLVSLMEYLDREIAMARDGGNPGWMVSLDGETAARMLHLLMGVAGLLYHLGHTKSAAGALLRQHQPTFSEVRAGGDA